MKSPDNQLGYRIKAAREEKKLTQEKLAEAAGISTVYLAEIENKRTIPSFPVLCSICKIVNISLDDIIYHTDSDMIRKTTRLLSQCDEKQLYVIHNMIEAMLQAELYR